MVFYDLVELAVDVECCSSLDILFCLNGPQVLNLLLHFVNVLLLDAHVHPQEVVLDLKACYLIEAGLFLGQPALDVLVACYVLTLYQVWLVFYLPLLPLHLQLLLL